MSAPFFRLRGDVWGDPALHSMDVTTKLVLVYLRGNAHANAAGVYRLGRRFGYIALDLDLEAEKVAAAMAALREADLVLADAETGVVYLPDWFSHNSSGTPNHARHLLDLWIEGTAPLDCPDIALKAIERTISMVREATQKMKVKSDRQKKQRSQINADLKTLEGLSNDLRMTFEVSTSTSTSTSTSRSGGGVLTREAAEEATPIPRGGSEQSAAAAFLNDQTRTEGAAR